MICAIPDHWVVRELTERDYGIDLVVEVFEAAGLDKKGHEKFETSGGLFHIQVKGTRDPVKVNKEGYVEPFRYSRHNVVRQGIPPIRAWTSQVNESNYVGRLTILLNGCCAIS